MTTIRKDSGTLVRTYCCAWCLHERPAEQFNKSGYCSTCHPKDAPRPAPPEVVWYAAAGGIAQAGPFDTQVKAWAAIRLTKEVMLRSNSKRPYADNAIVWCEEAP